MDDLDSIVAGYTPDFEEPTRAVVADDHGDLIADRSDANGISQRVQYLVVTDPMAIGAREDVDVFSKHDRAELSRTQDFLFRRAEALDRT